MAILEDIGKKIRTLRTEKQMSREIFCGDEKELTVRQLGRIETGKSLPSLPKLEFIAKTLDIPLSYLIDNKVVIIPDHYLNLKNKLILMSTYGDKERLSLKEQILDEIFENFYENLPEEEQLSIDILQSFIDVSISLDVKYGESLLEEYIEQLRDKEKYNTNDLLLIHLYSLQISTVDQWENDIKDMFIKRLIEQEFCSDLAYMKLLGRVILGFVAVIEYEKKYEEFPKFIKVLNMIMEETNDFLYKPVVTMFEARYQVDYVKNRKKALELYDRAILGAELINDMQLRENILADKNLFF